MAGAQQLRVALVCLSIIVAVLVCAAIAGFTSLDCGGAQSFNSTTGIQWEPDSSFIATGIPVDLSSALPAARLQGLPVELRTLRSFPPSSAPRKNCFILPTDSGKVYLVRSGFFHGPTPAPAFALSIGATAWTTVSASGSFQTSAAYHEAMYYAATESVAVCLLRLKDQDTPFINSLELRSMLPGAYELAAVAGVNLNLILRTNFGGLFTRYPGDPRDRFWADYLEDFSYMGNYTVIKARRKRNVSDPQGTDQPPDAVMRTAVSSPVVTVSIAPSLFPDRQIQAYAWLYFAEIDKLRKGERRIIDWLCDGDKQTIDLASSFPPFTTIQFGYLNRTLEGSFDCVLSRDAASGRDPLLNAMEVYAVQRKSAGTLATNGQALQALKDGFRLRGWSGDPCLPVPWDQLKCSEDVPSRVTSLNLTSMNLTGFIPDSISKLTSLTILDLSGNRFTGPIPSSFAALKSLQILDLGNNDLSGAFPGWLTLKAFPGLQLLSVKNNRLNGTFPANFITTKGFSFEYSGNVDLCSSQGCPRATSPAPAPAPVPIPPPTALPTSYPASGQTSKAFAPNQIQCALLVPLLTSVLAYMP